MSTDDSFFGGLDTRDPKSSKRSDSFVDFEGESKEVQQKATSIKLHVRVMELRLRGYVWDSKLDNYIYKGDPLCGESVINKATGLIQSFAEDSNLITGKSFSTFSKQKWELCSTFNKTLFADRGGIPETYEVAMKMFKNTLQNIGDIILESKGVLKDWYGKEERINKEEL